VAGGQIEIGSPISINFDGSINASQAILRSSKKLSNISVLSLKPKTSKLKN